MYYRVRPPKAVLEAAESGIGLVCACLGNIKRATTTTSDFISENSRCHI